MSSHAASLMAISERVSIALSKVRVWGVVGIINYLQRSFICRVQRHRLVKCVKASRVSSPTPGITVIGDLTGQVSLSKTMRDFILNLRDSGIPVQTYDTLLRHQIPDADVARIVTPLEEFDIGRYSHIVMMYRCPLPSNLLPQCHRVRIVFHDSEHGIREMAPFLAESGDGIVGMSDFNFEYFRRTFRSQPVFKITYPFRFKVNEATSREELRTKYGIGLNDFVVFFNFDFGSYYRKNIPAAIRAFAQAFRGDLTAKLLFKTKGASANRKQLHEMEKIVKESGISDQFVHISQYLPRADVDGLTDACDVYLSLHKAEGFGIGMAEAMSQGKPVVATNWSANTEFCMPDTAWCIPYRMVPILPYEYPVSMKEWAEADVEAAAAALREIRDNPKAAAERASRGAKFMAEHFSIANFKKSVEAFMNGSLSEHSSDIKSGVDIKPDVGAEPGERA